MLTTPPRPARGLLVAGGFLAVICALSVADASLSQANRQPSTHTTVAQGAEVPMLDGTHQQGPLRMRASVGPRRFEVSMVTAEPAARTDNLRLVRASKRAAIVRANRLWGEPIGRRHAAGAVSRWPGR